ncbi:alpha-N-arabinofuranosidase [Oceanicaulis sp.]|uniref:alpha-N-arabinofuranosidase n=1 Tax=Oceanicaulis sp. TaxID=1924941 RepID=UPI003F72CE7E
MKRTTNSAVAFAAILAAGALAPASLALQDGPPNPADVFDAQERLDHWRPARNAELRADLDATGAPIAPEIYGHFAEHLGRGIYEGIWVGPESDIPNTNGYRQDVVEALNVLDVPVVRWPGGCFADEYDWRDGIGPRDERPVRINTHWGWVTEDNSFGTHEFMNFAELINADAYVAGNMGSGSPREMAQWVEYMTSDMETSLAEERRANGRDEPWDMPYFGVGNESWGCGGHMTGEYSADLHNRYATFIKSPPGAETRVARVATGANVNDYAFTRALMRDARPWLMDALSLHYYTFAGRWEDKGAATEFTESEWGRTLYHALFLEELVAEHSAIMDEYDPEKRVGLYVDEFGTWFESTVGSTPGFLEQQNTIRDALVAGLSYNILHRHTDRVRMANIAQMVNVLQASILTRGEEMILTPTYHLIRMYQPFRGATPIDLTIEAPSVEIGGDAFPHVDASLARMENGDLVLSLINLHPTEAITVPTNLSGSVTGEVLTGASIDAHNTFEAPETVTPAIYDGARERNGALSFALEPRSVTVVRIAQD